jgi:uncharacterized protein
VSDDPTITPPDGLPAQDLQGEALVREGAGRYARGDYFDAHESWEALWRATPPGPSRECLQGLIQLAAALHQLFCRHNAPSALRILARARAHLARGPERFHGLDVPSLVEDTARTAAVIQEHLDDPAALASAPVPTISLGPAGTASRP